MALISCPECHQSVSDQAATCPHCGYSIATMPSPGFPAGRLPAKSTSKKWLIFMLVASPFVFLFIAFFFLLANELDIASDLPLEEPLSVKQSCPTIDAASLWLPVDKEFAAEAFRRKAEQLNASGLCVIGGGFGRNSDKFYISINTTGDAKDAYSKTFTYEELKD